MSAKERENVRLNKWREGRGGEVEDENTPGKHRMGEGGGESKSERDALTTTTPPSNEIITPTSLSSVRKPVYTLAPLLNPPPLPPHPGLEGKEFGPWDRANFCRKFFFNI